MSEDGYIILLNSKIYSGFKNTNLNITKNLTFINIDNITVIDGGENSRIFNVYSNQINISGLTFKNGLADNGGAIKFNEELSDCIINATFINNKASQCGGAIYFAKAASNVTVESEFRSNTAKDANAMYFNKRSSEVLISDSLFLNNNAWVNDINCDGGVSLKESWFGGTIQNPNVYVENVDVLNYLILNPTFYTDGRAMGLPITMDLNLYSYNPTTQNIDKYTGNKFENLTLSLYSNRGVLNKDSVKLGEEFMFLPIMAPSFIVITCGDATTTIHIIGLYSSLSGDAENLTWNENSGFSLSDNFGAFNYENPIFGNEYNFTDDISNGGDVAKNIASDKDDGSINSVNLIGILILIICGTIFVVRRRKT